MVKPIPRQIPMGRTRNERKIVELMRNVSTKHFSIVQTSLDLEPQTGMVVNGSIALLTELTLDSATTVDHAIFNSIMSAKTLGAQTVESYAQKKNIQQSREGSSCQKI